MSESRPLARFDVRPGDPPGEPPTGPNHALLIGELAGAASALGPVTVLDDRHGVHTDEFLIRRPSGTWRVTVQPEDVIDP